MGKGIKTREVVKNIKVHDTAVNVGDRMKNIGVKTKDTVNENINQADNVTPEQYATDKVSEAMRTGSESVAIGTEKAIRKGASKTKDKIKDKRAEKKAAKEKEKEPENPPDEEAPEGEKLKGESDSSPKEKSSESGKQQNSQKTTKSKTDKGDANVVKEKQDKPVIKEKTQVPPKTKTQPETTVEEIKKPRQRKQTAPKTKGKANIKKLGAEKQTVKTVNNEARKIPTCGEIFSEQADRLFKVAVLMSAQVCLLGRLKAHRPLLLVSVLVLTRFQVK